MATTLDGLVHTVKHLLTGMDAVKESVTALASPLTADATDLYVTDLSSTGGAGRGLVEVDFELMRASAVSIQDSVVSLYSFGRGYRGTTAVAHEAGSEVRFNPAFPMSSIVREINGVLTQIYPAVYGVSSYETEFPSDYGAIDMPTDAIGVISVWVEDRLRADQWLREDRWSFRPDSTSVSTARPLRVGGEHTPGTEIRVVYATRPGLFDVDGSLSQDFETVTGLDERCTDLVHIGVAARLAPFVDVAKLPFLAAEADAMGDAKAVGTGASLTRLLYSLFQARVEQESLVLGKEHPIRAHWAG